GPRRRERGAGVALLECRRRLGELDEHPVSQLTLRVVGNADFDDLWVITLAHPLVILRIAQIFRDVRHGCGAYNRSARGASPAPSSSLSAMRSQPRGRRSSHTATGSGSGDK